VNPVRWLVHVTRRWRASLDRSPLPIDDLDFARRTLTSAEFDLWSTMTLADRRHSLVVARRFVALVPTAVDAEIAAALLHDVGKSVDPMATTQRILATLVEPVVRPRRWEAYYRHEEIGLDLCRGLPSRDRTLTLLAGGDDPMVEALRRADDV
jgi:hypothetical protein